MAACNITRTEFAKGAKPLELAIGSQSAVADAREFSTGSFGWSFNGKMPFSVDGKLVQVQVNVNLAVIGSKAVA